MANRAIKDKFVKTDSDEEAAPKAAKTAKAK